MVMPTRRDLIDARRWDLHHAVVLHGGYGAVAKTLKWPRARWAEDRHLLNFDIFSKELLDCMENEIFDQDEDEDDEVSDERMKTKRLAQARDFLALWNYVTLDATISPDTWSNTAVQSRWPNACA